MGRFKRGLGGVLMGFGGIAAIAFVSNLGLAWKDGGLKMVLFMLGMTAGSLLLGWLGHLLRRSGAVEKPDCAKNQSHTASKPPQSRAEPKADLIKEKRKRQLKEPMARAKQARIGQEQEKQRWQEEHPELLSYFQELEHRYQVLFLRRYFPEVPDAERLDGVQDHTNVYWMALRQDAELTRAVELLKEIKRLCDQYGYEDIKYADWSVRLFSTLAGKYCHLLLGREQFDAAKGQQELLCTWCRENRIRLVVLDDGNYHDLVDGDTYEVYLAGTYPGCADDAATYGSVEMRVITK